MDSSRIWIEMYVQFGEGWYCSDSAARAAQFGFTAVDRPEGYLILAVVGLGDEILELTKPEEVYLLLSALLIRCLSTEGFS